MIINMTHHQLQVWGGAIALATGAVVTLMIIMSMAAGLSYRLFMVTSGRGRRRAQSARKPVHRSWPGSELVPMSARLLDHGAGEDTAELDVTEAGQ